MDGHYAVKEKGFIGGESRKPHRTETAARVL